MEDKIKEFFHLNNDLKSKRIKSLIGKHAIYEIECKEGGYINVPGILLEYKNSKLYINLYKEGYETKDELDFCEWIPIENIVGIEEYDITNQNTLLKTLKSNSYYTIKNKNNKELEIFYLCGDLTEIEFYFKNENGENIHSCYPTMLIKSYEKLINA